MHKHLSFCRVLYEEARKLQPSLQHNDSMQVAVEKSTLRDSSEVSLSTLMCTPQSYLIHHVMLLTNVYHPHSSLLTFPNMCINHQVMFSFLYQFALHLLAMLISSMTFGQISPLVVSCIIPFYRMLNFDL